MAAKPAEAAQPAKKRRSPKPPPVPSGPEWVRCDANIEVLAATTTCPFAQNTFWAYWTSDRASSLSVWSPAAKSNFATSCVSDGAEAVCSTSDGGKVRFPQAAVDAYSQAQADAYAADHDLGPDPDEALPQAQTTPTRPDPALADEDPPSADYDDTPEEPAPAPGENIRNYDNGRGYRVQCEDGTYSQSGGIQGACSWHGGVAD